MSQHSRPPKHAPDPQWSDSQILALVYQKVFEIDEQLLDPQAGEIPEIKRRVSHLEHTKSRAMGALKLTSWVVGSLGGVAGIFKLIHG